MPALYTKPAPPSDDKRWRIVETRMRRMGDRPAVLIEALHAAQEAFGFLDEPALHYVGDTLGVPHSRAYGGGDLLLLLHAQAARRAHRCRVHGHRLLHQQRQGHHGRLEKRLGLKSRQTTEDGKISLLTARCLGACGLAPAVVVDSEARGKVGAGDLIAQLETM
jgi:bidirectional [NiFe] hydrogenase diaphorase subunit